MDMKKLRNSFVLSKLLFLTGGYSLAASDVASSSSSYTKYIAIGVAALIIVLLLFLGYKMDSKEGKSKSDYPSKKMKKEKQSSKALREDIKYEADDISYEKDVVNTNDLVDFEEYNEDGIDNTDSMAGYNNYDNVENEDDINFGFTEDFSELPNEEDSNEEEIYGEEFDTSILDNIDDDDDFNFDSSSNEKAKTVSDETMIFNNLNDDFNINNIEKKESDFQGFSVAPMNYEEETKEIKNKRKYTKSKKSNESEEFSKQIDENLDKSETKKTKSKTTASKQVRKTKKQI